VGEHRRGKCEALNSNPIIASPIKKKLKIKKGIFTTNT
jgi:hypothetical protein